MSQYKHILTDFKDLRKVIGEITKTQPAKSRYQQQAEKMKYIPEESKYIKVARDVVKKKSAKKVDGVLLDLFTASAIIQVYDTVNSQNKKRMDRLKLKQLADIAFKLASGKKEEVDFDEKVTEYSIKNTKTGQTYSSGHFPQSKSRLAKIRKGGGDHKYAAMHKDGKVQKEEVDEAISHNRLNTIQKDSVKALFRAVNQADGVKDRTAVGQSSKSMEKGTRAFQLHFDSQNPDVQEVIAKTINKVMKKSEMFALWDAKFSKRVASFGEEINESRMKELHGYIEQGKSAEWIAKKMKVDVKTIKSLMNEEVVPSRSKQVKE